MKIKFLIPVILIIFMTSCTQVVVNTEDEIRINSWRANLMNGTVVTLSFKNDTAEFCAKSKDSDAQTTIKGICFFDEKSMLIYNKNDSEPYIFEYEIKNNKLILKYGGGKLVLTREK